MTPAAAGRVIVGTALAYAVVGWLALLLAVPPGYASPLYPSAGIALAAVLTFGRIAVPGVLLGAFLVNVVLSASRGQLDAAALLLPVAIGTGAALQSALGAALVRRFVAQPLLLAAPRDILRAGLLGGLLACALNPTLATLALLLSGAIGSGQVAMTWATWWIGDGLGALIGTPLALTLIGRPRADWAPRRRTVGLPLGLATLLLAAATLVVSRWDEQRLTSHFEREAERIAIDAETRLRKPVHALQALNSAYLAASTLSTPSLRAASQWWLTQPFELQAMGYSVRVPRSEVAAFETQARDDDLPAYRVFEREGGALAAGDTDVVAMRHVEPRTGNAAALGVNVMSVPETRPAVERARDTGKAVASEPFRVTQASGDETGFVVYQAVYEGTPADEAERRARFRGVLFVTVRAERLLEGLGGMAPQFLGWCLVDTDPAAARKRLAGPDGCESHAANGSIGSSVLKGSNGPGGPSSLEHRRLLGFQSRPLELRVWASPGELRARQQPNAWLFSVAGLLAAALLGALLLTVTGRARRIEVAVHERTAELRREVQERTQAETALRDSEERMRSILDNVPIGVMFLDLQGRIVETNPHLCEMLGRPATALLRSSLAEISHPEEHAENARQFIELLTRSIDTSRRRMRLLRANGEVLWVRAHLTVLRDVHGQALRLAGVAEDITEHLRLEESERALDRAEAANRAKSEFVSRMSHELRTPLNAMIGFSQLLGLDNSPALVPHQREWTEQVQRAGWHLLEMINDTLDLARIESGAVHLALQPLELAPVVRASLAMVSNAAQQRGVTLQQTLPAEAPLVLGDATRLKQVLTNLLSNAVKYNREGGSVWLNTGVDAEGRVVISVSDSGMGMTAEQMAALFQPYNRLGRERSGIEGTGIGLVISRRLVELMGGTLEASSVAGQGSVFTLRLAASADSRAATVPVPAAPEAQYHQRVVHYIEDNETNIEVMRGILLQRPQIALEVSMLGLDALAAIRHRRPDLILLDMHLPDISGLELLRHLKNDDDVASIPVIVVSADATAARMREALTLGATHYVTKPVDIARLLAMLDETLAALETRWGA